MPTRRCPRGLGHRDWWVPNPGPQTLFLQTSIREVLYGGAAGGGKTAALLLDAAGHYIGKGYGRHYRGILLRRTFPELEDTVIPKSKEFYPSFGGVYNSGKHAWTFPGGEVIQFGHAQREEDITRYLGGEYQWIGFDELTTFTKSQYLALIERLRSSYGIPLRLRAATNPGSEGHEWVFERFGAWLDPDAAVVARPGVPLYFVKDARGEEHMVPAGTKLARARTFIPARLEDNPYLFNDGEYEATLQQLDPVKREQKRRGDWLVKPSKGLYFNRLWVKFIDRSELPKDLTRVRYWDLAATEPEDGKQPDFTEGVLLGMTPDRTTYYVIDNVGGQWDPGDVESKILKTAESDGREVAIGMEQEPGASGKTVTHAYARKLVGYNFSGKPKRSNKVVAFGPFSADCKNKKVIVVRGEWNDAWLFQLEQFPEGRNDDKCDATSGGHTYLTTMPKPRVDRGAHVGGWQKATTLDERPIG